MKYMQSFYMAAGKWCCYALCLVEVAKKWWAQNKDSDFPISDTDALLFGIGNKYIDFKESDYLYEGNFYVRYPELFLGRLTGGIWSVRREPLDYIAQKDEYVINFYAKTKEDADKGIGHFVFGDNNTLQYSATVAFGKVFSKRVCKKTK